MYKKVTKNKCRQSVETTLYLSKDENASLSFVSKEEPEYEEGEFFLPLYSEDRMRVPSPIMKEILGEAGNVKPGTYKKITISIEAYTFDKDGIMIEP